MHINQERIFVLIASFALEYKHYCLNRNSTCFLFLNWSWLYVWLYICLRMWLVSNLFSTTLLQVTTGQREFAYCGLVLSHGLLLHIGFYNSLRLSLLYRSVQEKNSMLCLWTNVESRSINTHKRGCPITSHLDQTNLVNTPQGIVWLFIAILIWKFLHNNTSCSFISDNLLAF